MRIGIRGSGLMGGKLGTIFALRRAKSLGARMVVPHWAFASRPFIDRAHQAGLEVVVWTVNQPEALRRKIADGVDGIITDYPARLAEMRDCSGGL